MKSKKLLILIITISNLISINLYAQSSYKIEIQTLNPQVKVYEPLMIKIIYQYQNPKTSLETEEIISQFKLKDLWINVNKKGEKEELKYEIYPVTFVDNSGKGFDYSGWSIVFYCESEKIFIFDEPGTYNCYINPASGNVHSNTISINVQPPSEKEKEAMSILYPYPLSRQKTELFKIELSPYVKTVVKEGARRATGVTTAAKYTSAGVR